MTNSSTTRSALAEKSEYNVFYAVAILFVIALPVGVPTIITMFHAISGWRQKAATARAARVPARRPAFSPAVPAAA